MLRVYLAVLICTAIFLSYFVGGHVANVRCRERATHTAVEQIVNNNAIMENTNDTVLHTSVGDIRHILRERYTIAE